MSDYISRADLARKAVKMHGFGEAEYVSLRNIMVAPAANVAPVVHAGWLDLDHGFQMCSECGERCIEDRDDLPFKAYGFCPYCGAKMDQEVIVLAPEARKND